MAQVTLDGGQSSAALGGQTITYVAQYVAQQVPGAPDTLIESTLTRVLTDFYTKSTAWRANIGPYPINANIAEVDLNPVDQNTRLQFVLGAYMFPFDNSNRPIPLYPTVRQFVGGTPAEPSRYYMQTPDQMILYPTPDQNYGDILYVYGALIPTTLAAQLPDMSFTQHADALIWGCLARLYMMSKRPWSDKALGMDFEKKYRREILIYRDIANRGYGPADTGFRFPPFAGRSTSQVLPKAVG